MTGLKRALEILEQQGTPDVVVEITSQIFEILSRYDLLTIPETIGLGEYFKFSFEGYVQTGFLTASKHFGANHPVWSYGVIGLDGHNNWVTVQQIHQIRDVQSSISGILADWFEENEYTFCGAL